MDGSPSAPSAIRVPERPDAAAASPTPRPRGNAAPSPSSIPPVDVSREVPAGMPSPRDVRADLGGPQCSSDHGGGTEGEEEEVETWRPFDPPDPETPGTEFAEADEAEPEVPPGVRTDGAFPYECIGCGKPLDEPLPDSCPGCGASLSGGEAVPPGEEASSSDETPEGVVLFSTPDGSTAYECRHCGWPLGEPPLPDRCGQCGRRLRGTPPTTASEPSPAASSDRPGDAKGTPRRERAKRWPALVAGLAVLVTVVAAACLWGRDLLELPQAIRVGRAMARVQWSQAKDVTAKAVLGSGAALRNDHDGKDHMDAVRVLRAILPPLANWDPEEASVEQLGDHQYWGYHLVWLCYEFTWPWHDDEQTAGWGRVLALCVRLQRHSAFHPPRSPRVGQCARRGPKPLQRGIPNEGQRR